MSENSSCRDVHADNKMKKKVQDDEPIKEAEEFEDPMLDLRLSSNNNEIIDVETKLELNLLGLIDDNCARVSESAGDEGDKKATKKKHFLCKYCSKKFTNSQALGGHQNAHKRERSLLRKEKGQDLVVPYTLMDASMYPFPGMGGFASHGPLSRPLGINMHSMVHKPPSQHSFHHILPAGYAYEYCWPTNNAFPPINNTLAISHRPLHPSSLSKLNVAANRINLAGIDSSGNPQCDLAGHNLSLNL